MGDWWFVLFWILLVPLVIIEIIVYVKSKKFYWLLFSLAIFTYVVMVSYWIDVFDLGKDPVIIILVVSALLMAYIGRIMGKGVKKQKRVSKSSWTLLWILIAVMVALIVLGRVFVSVEESVSPASSLTKEDVLQQYDTGIAIKEGGDGTVLLLTRTVTNPSFLSAPYEQKNYAGCLYTDTSNYPLNLWPQAYDYSQQAEVKPEGTVTIKYTTNPVSVSKEEYKGITPSKIILYETKQYAYDMCNNPDSATIIQQYEVPIVG